MHLAPVQHAAAQDVPMLFLNLRAERPQALQMQIDGPKPDLAPAGIGEIRLSEAREHRSQQKNRGAHFLGERLRHGARGRAGGIHDQLPSFARRLAAEAFQHLAHTAHIR